MIKQWGGDLVKYLPAKLVPALVSLISIPIVTRLFAPEYYGNYILVLSTVSLVTATTSSWLLAAIIRFFPAYRLNSKLGAFYSTSFILAVAPAGLIAVLFLFVLLGIRSHISSDLYFLMLIGVLIFVANSIFNVLIQVLRAKGSVSLYASFSLWHSLAGLFIGLGLVISLHYGVEGLMWGSFISMAVVLPFLYKIAFKGYSTKMRFFSGSLGREMVRFGLPLIPTYLFVWILAGSDRYVLQLYHGSFEVGLYSVGYAVSSGCIGFIISLFTLTSGPLIVSVWENEGRRATQQFIRRLTRYYIIIGLPATVGLSVLSGQVIDVFTAHAYHGGFIIVPLVAFSAFLIGLQWLAHFGLFLSKKTNIVMFIFLGSALLNIALNILFVPRYGLFAAGITTLVSYAACFLLITISSGKQLPWDFPIGSLTKTALATTIMGIAVYFFSNIIKFPAAFNLFLSVSVGILIYSLSLFLIREVQRDEMRNALALISRLAGKLNFLSGKPGG